MKIKPTRINTKTVWQFIDGEYVEVYNEGYDYSGPIAKAGGGSANTGTEAWRFYASDNSSAIAAQDTDPTTLEVDTTYVVRVRVANTGTKDENADPYDIYYDNTTKATGRTAITASSTHVQTANATGLTDTTAVTSGTLTGASGSFINGEEVEDGISGSITLTTGNYTEIWYSFTIVGTAVDDNDNIDLYIARNGTALDFDLVQSITVNKANPTTVTLQSDSLTLSDGTLGVNAKTNVALIADSFTLSEGTLNIFAEEESRITLQSDSFTISEGTLSVTRSFTITPVPDALTLSDGTLGVNARSNIGLVSDDMTLTDGTLGISQSAATNITLQADSLTLSDGTLGVNARTNITLGADSFTLSDGTLGVNARQNITLVSDSLTLTDGTLSIRSEEETRVTLQADSLTLSDGTLGVNARTNVSLTGESLTVNEGTLVVTQTSGVTTVNLQADSFTLSGGTLTVTQDLSDLAYLSQYINELWQLAGLDRENPTTITGNTVSSASWTINYEGNENQKTLTRTGYPTRPVEILSEMVEKLRQYWQTAGLDPANPMIHSRSLQSVGDIEVTITGNGETSSILTRSDQNDYLDINTTGDDLLINDSGDKLEINNHG